MFKNSAFEESDFFLMQFNFDLSNFLWIPSKQDITLFTQLFLQASNRVSNTQRIILFATDWRDIDLNDRYYF